MSNRTIQSTITLNNFSAYPTDKLVEIIQFVAPPNIGNLTINVKEGDGWDGECEPESGVIDIVLEKDEEGFRYPPIWAINRTFKENYLRNITFNSFEEFLVHILAHEQFHRYFWKNRNVNVFNGALDEVLRIDEETLCDIFACAKLNNWIAAQKMIE